MAKKKGGTRKTKKEEKKKEFLKLLDNCRNQCEEYETRMNSLCDNACDKVRKMFDDKLKSLPENVRKMTLAEYIASQEKIMQEKDIEIPVNLRPEFERTKLMSEKKKTLKKARKEERKRSMSVCSTIGSKESLHPALVPRMSRVLSETNLSTPLNKRSVAPSYVVTPKFNPRVPINKNHLRRPKPGEIVMSIDGSPLQNVIDDIPQRPGVAVSLGNGKVIKITEDTELSSLENEFAKRLNEDTKQTLEIVKRKLGQILDV